MGKLALPHRGQHRTLPPAALLEPFVERTKHHWFWLDDFYDDNLDRSPVFRWGGSSGHSGTFMVSRLMWQYAHQACAGQRLVLENACGLFTCINPSHWAERGVAFTVPTVIRLLGDEASPVIFNSETLVHIQWKGSGLTVCGSQQGYGSHVLEMPVTCYACIAVWVAQKRPHMVIK